MHMRRFTRLTNGFRKKVENHMHTVALHFMYYNFVKVHQTLKVTPAMEAGLTNCLRDIYDLVAIIDANEETWSLQEANFKVTHYPFFARDVDPSLALFSARKQLFDAAPHLTN